jgi:hypothetical protein
MTLAARGLGQHPRCGQRDRGADGHVDEQHPPPGGVGGEQAAADQANGAAGDAHRGVDAERPGARRAFGEGGGDQRQRGRGDQRAAGALDGAGGEQEGLAGGEPAGQGGGGKQQQPGDEHRAAAEQVPGPAAEQQQPAEGQRVGVDHPFQAGSGKAERPLDVRQRDVDDGRVQHHHQLRGGEDHQARPGLGPAAVTPPGGAARAVLDRVPDMRISPKYVLASRWVKVPAWRRRRRAVPGRGGRCLIYHRVLLADDY